VLFFSALLLVGLPASAVEESSPVRPTLEADAGGDGSSAVLVTGSDAEAEPEARPAPAPSQERLAADLQPPELTDPGAKLQEASEAESQAAKLKPCISVEEFAGTLPAQEPSRVPAWNRSEATVSFWGTNSDRLEPAERVNVDRAVVEGMETLGALEVVSAEDMKALLDEQARRRLAGCTDDTCLEEVQRVVAKARTTHLLTFNLVRVEGEWVGQLALFGSEDGTQVGRVTVRASRLERLERRIKTKLSKLLGMAGLRKESVGPGGYPWPHFHLTLKFGNAISRLANLDLNLLSYRLDVETNLYITHRVLIFLVVGMSLGSRSSTASEAGQDSNAVRVQILPATFGAKHLWTFARLRAWLGGGIGTGVLGLVQGDGKRDFKSSFALTLVGGVDFRVHRNVALALEASTNLSDAVLGVGSGDTELPVVVGLTAGVSVLFD